MIILKRKSNQSCLASEPNLGKDLLHPLLKGSLLFQPSPGGIFRSGSRNNPSGYHCRLIGSRGQLLRDWSRPLS
jgi:hypothetical protein